jgi:ectoine hydroxylase-related dioxygenase (phytanoyl-CoA dioxygenase family)
VSSERIAPVSSERIAAANTSIVDGPDALESIVEEGFDASRFPLSADVESGVLVYDGQEWSGCEGDRREALRRELAAALAEGPGVFLIRHAFESTGIVDEATEVFLGIIASERESGTDRGDHFGAPGANARIWNAQQKLALAAPEVFVRYFANDGIAVASEAWLGPAYQMTSQVNLIYPGGVAQEPHCDYHLGFQSDAGVASYPPHVHRMSPMLTLQGAVAHGDMPVSSGTTMLLPNSQKFSGAYTHYRASRVREVFARHMIQLPLAKGDVIFFSPALIHGAGTNLTTDVERMANLLQVSSAFGRAMETLDRRAMCEAVYPTLQGARDAGWPAWAVDNAIASCAEGYPFPTDLDRDQPIGGLAPPSQADVLRRCLDSGVTAAQLSRELAAWQERRSP